VGGEAEGMNKILMGITLVLSLSLAACGSSGNSASGEAAQKQADLYAIDQIERSWHKASSTHDVNLMMTLWATDATFNIGTETLSGKTQIRDFFTHKAGPFQSGNHWLSDTPAYKIRTTVNGDKGTLYFECHYIDVKTQKVVSVVGADQNVQKIDGKWLITSSAAATPTLSP
jgi:ketosteroid isomerase-like protein